MKSAFWFVVLLVVFVLSGCGGGGKAPIGPVDPPVSTDWRISLSQSNFDLYPGGEAGTLTVSAYDGGSLSKTDDIVFDAPSEVTVTPGSMKATYRVSLVKNLPATTTYNVSVYHRSHSEYKQTFSVYTGPAAPVVYTQVIEVSHHYDNYTLVTRTLSADNQSLKWETPTWLYIFWNEDHLYHISLSNNEIPGKGEYTIYGYIDYPAAPGGRIRSNPVTIKI